LQDLERSLTVLFALANRRLLSYASTDLLEIAFDGAGTGAPWLDATAQMKIPKMVVATQKNDANKIGCILEG
jgi:hypothetical protein